MATGTDNSNKKALIFGTKVKLDNVPLFRTESYPTSHRSVSGTYFLYDGKCVNGRYKIVSSKQAVMFRPEPMVFIGWVEESYLTKA